MKTIVTGGAGFIGSHLTDRLIELGHDVTVIDDLSAGNIDNLNIQAKFIQMDVCNVGDDQLRNVDVVFHQAASKKNICLINPARDLEVNGSGTLNLLRGCIRNGVKKFVHASTGSVYGEVEGEITEDTPVAPVSYYGVSKLAGESYVRVFNRLYGLNTTVLRYFHVWGDRQDCSDDKGGVVAIFRDKILKGNQITIYGNGNQIRVFTRVEDIIEANIQSWYNPVSEGKTYNCASSQTVTVLQLAKYLMAGYNRRVDIKHDPPLLGDIYNFDVNSEKIKEIGVYFKSFLP